MVRWTGFAGFAGFEGPAMACRSLSSTQLSRRSTPFALWNIMLTWSTAKRASSRSLVHKSSATSSVDAASKPGRTGYGGTQLLC